MTSAAFLYNIPETPEEHQHSHPQLVFGLSGNSKMRMDGRDIDLDYLKGCIIPANTRHFFFGIGANANITINFSGLGKDDTLKRIFEKPCCFTIDHSMRKFAQFSAMELPLYEGSTNIGNDEFSRQIIDIFKKLLVDRLSEKAEPSPAMDLEKVDQYMEKRLQEKITVEELARHVHVSPSHFYTLFRKETGVSPHQYLIRKRVEKANELLRHTRKSIVEISEYVGFSSQSALNNTFKLQFGYTPGSVRKNLKGHETAAI